ncbi:hypothetical protein [Pandoraea vervacti]|nr:hypothetical protein [Pandoraea vervacti]
MNALGVGVNMENLEMHYEIVAMSPAWGSVVHQYKSRNTYKNALGVGWCNAIHLKTAKEEKHIDIETRAVVAKDSVTIENCGMRQQFGDAIRFEPDRATRTKLVGTTLQTLARNGADILLSSPETFATVKISRTGIDVWHPGFSVGVQTYDWSGKLVSVAGMAVETDAAGRVVKLLAPDAQGVTFIYDGAHLAKIQGPGGSAANYAFEGDQLSELDNAWRKRYAFAYSDRFNLQSIVYPDQTRFTFFYDETRDVITGFLNRNGCMETYSQIAGQDADHYKAQSTLVCDGKKMQERTVTLVFGKNGYLTDRRDVTLDDKGEVLNNISYPAH